MQIDEAAQSTGLTADTIRFYEKSGMLPEIARDGRGWRQFRPSDVNWLKTLGYLRATGMPLDDVKAFANSAHAPHSEIPAEQALRLDILQRHAKTLAQRRAELDACQAYLDHKITIYSNALDTA